MNVKDIKLVNFRNYENISVDLNDKLNIFIGKNAQGKTNLIESIYMCSKGNSFRTNKDNEIINFEKDETYIGCNVNINNYNRLIELKLNRNNPKIIRINKTPLKSYKELNSGLNLVVFSPEDLKIVKEGPSFRRDLLDKSIIQIRPVYNYNLNKYNKILNQRNNILKSNRLKGNMEDLLEAFDIQLVKVGSSIMLNRMEYIGMLNEQSKSIHKVISNDKENLDIEYSSNIEISDIQEELENNYYKALKDSIKRDMEYRSTQVGPHRDDLIINLNDNSARVFGSQGQQRSIVLSLKLAEVEILKKVRGSYPVLLLDDVYSELDVDRRKYLTKLFNDMQTFITMTNVENLDKIDYPNKTIYYIENGSIINRRM